MWGELASHKRSLTHRVLKAGHPVSYSFVACLFVSWDGGFLGFVLLLSVSLLVCYTHIIPCTTDTVYVHCIYIHVHTCT